MDKNEMEMKKTRARIFLRLNDFEVMTQHLFSDIREKFDPSIDHSNMLIAIGQSSDFSVSFEVVLCEDESPMLPF